MFHDGFFTEFKNEKAKEGIKMIKNNGLINMSLTLKF